MNFNPTRDIPPLTGKVILITGGTSGLGKETVRQLSTLPSPPAHIYFTARNPTKANQVLNELSHSHPTHSPISFLEMNQSSLTSVRAAAKSLLAQTLRLDILICNAGTTGLPSTTQDGYETSMGVNHLSHALLIQLLLPLLLDTASSNNNSGSPLNDVRIISLTSMAERFAPKQYTFPTLHSPCANMGVMARYGQSKLANIHYMLTLSRMYPSITFAAVHPGNVRTSFGDGFFEGRPWLAWFARVFLQPFITVLSVEEGCRGVLWCGFARREDGGVVDEKMVGVDGKAVESGVFYHPVGIKGKGSRRSRDEVMARELYDWTEEELKPYL